MSYKLAGGMGVLVVSFLVSTLVAQGAPSIEDARTLAENVLGAGQVKSISVADGGQTILIRWESSTYKQVNTTADTREVLYFEAVLATNSIIGRLPDVARVRFTMMHGAKMLATGESSRAHGTSVMFGPELGGGLYVPPPQPQPKRTVVDTGVPSMSE